MLDITEGLDGISISVSDFWPYFIHVLIKKNVQRLFYLKFNDFLPKI